MNDCKVIAVANKRGVVGEKNQFTCFIIKKLYKSCYKKDSLIEVERCDQFEKDDSVRFRWDLIKQ